MTALLLDSASIWYRAYFGMPDTLLSPTGEPVNAIKGYLDIAAKLIKQYRPDRLVAVIEGDWRPTWRTKLFPGYKANRVDDEGEEAEPDLLTPQIPILLDVLDAFGIPVIGIDDYEADDVIASLAKQFPGPIRIATGDRDLFQLVDTKKDVKIVYLANGLANHDLVDENWIAKKYGIPGKTYSLFSMIRGDSSDGLPGIKGIGEKGAAEIVNKFSSVGDLLAAAKAGDSRIKPQHQKKILQSFEYAQIMEKLVTCVGDLRLPVFNPTIANLVRDDTLLNDFAQNYGIASNIARLKDALER